MKSDITMEEKRFCRVCLVSKPKMYSLYTSPSNSIGIVFAELTQIQITDDNQFICLECANELFKFDRFRTRCLQTHSLLCQYTGYTSQKILQIIRSIDRHKYGLQSCTGISKTEILCDIPPEVTKNDDDSNINTNLINRNKTSDSPEVCVKMESNENCIKNNIEFGTKQIFETKQKEESNCNKLDNEQEICVKNIDHCDIDDELHDSDMIVCSDSKITAKSTKRCKKNTIKKFKSKKSKTPTDFSNEDLSDDEPLSKRVKRNENSYKEATKKNNVNIDLFNEYVTIVFLTLEDAKKELNARKDSSNYKRSPYKCEYCYKGYEAQAAFDNHNKKHSKEHGEFECDVCHLRFLKPIYLCKHKLSCHKRKFTCKLCPYVCYCMDQARTHVSLHQGKKYPCKDCGEIFSMPNSLLMHKRMKHFAESMYEYVCEFCGNTFASARGLFLHNTKLHRTDKNSKDGPNCEECEVHFASDVAWKRHLVLSSKHIVNNGCKYCGERFTNVEELKCHTRSHHPRTKQKKYLKKLPAACPDCNKWYSNRTEYNKHVTTEHPQSEEANKLEDNDLTPFVCEVCGQAFKQQCFLTYHQRKHTGERPYACVSCPKTFSMAGALAIHRSVHERTRAFKCHLCSRLFSFKSALNKHLKVHLGIRPHKCTICDKGFIHMCDLKLHIKYVHDKVPWPKKKSKKKVTDDSDTYLDYN